MKVPASIRQLFEEQEERNKRLQAVVEQRMQTLRRPRWHYESRVKSQISFALKLETGRFSNISRLEDFFACTLVVANTREIGEALELISEQFIIVRRRPHQPNQTHKSSNSFPFDDLRLYVRLKSDPALPPNGFEDMEFEIQIKTFLQHAWSIATHDLVYKSNAISWSQERLAFQIKAMLEHAELSIQEAERLADSPILNKEDEYTAHIRKMIILLRDSWSSDSLPNDIRRLAINVQTLIEHLGIDRRRLGEIISAEKAKRGGELPLNLSPYTTIIQALLYEERDKMQILLLKPRSSFKVVIPSEIDFPTDLNREQCINAIFIS